MDQMGKKQGTRLKLRKAFPKLRRFRKTSPADQGYNCIAWAAGVTDTKWWPSQFTFWPDGVPMEESVSAFIEAFATIRYRPCDSNDSGRDQDRIALYAKEGKVKHAAKQLPSGRWSSKLGDEEDIEHTLTDLEGDVYGSVSQLLCCHDQE